jgi:RNA polymerase sigma-54 factor
MSLAPRLDLRQSQSLVMTPQLQQAIRLLALSNLEVETFIAEEIERNPLLENAGVEDDGPTLEREAPPAIADEPASADSLVMGEGGGEAALDVDFAVESFHHDSASDQAGMDGSLGMTRPRRVRRYQSQPRGPLARSGRRSDVGWRLVYRAASDRPDR